MNHRGCGNEVEYINSKIERICTDQNYQKKVMAEQEARHLQKLMVKLFSAENLFFFMKPPNRKHYLEKLEGKRKNQLSLRTNEHSGYRIIFTYLNTTIEDDYINMTK